jgi:hypothetical protein
MDNDPKLEPTQLELGFDDDLSNSTFDISFSELNSGTYQDYTMLSSHNIDTITISSPAPTITLSPGVALPALTISNQAGTGTIAGAYITSGSNGGPVWTNTISPNSAKISLKGAGADIDIDGVSLVDTLKGIQDRLNILRPSVELESEWNELQELGERYRQLEAEFEEKSRVWKALKQ